MQKLRFLFGHTTQSLFYIIKLKYTAQKTGFLRKQTTPGHFSYI